MNQTDSKQSGNVWVILAVVVALLIVLAGGYYYYVQQQQAQKQAEEQAMMEEKQAEEEAMRMEQEKMMMEEAEDKLVLFQARAEALRLYLSDDAKEALDIVIDFVEADPMVLLEDSISSYPVEIQDAIEIVLLEASDMVAVNIDPEDASEDLIGETYTIQGVLMLGAADSPLGPYYTVVDAETAETFYFVPADAVEEYEALEGEEVTVTVEITGVEAGNLLYEVTSGPTSIEVEETTPLEESDTTEETDIPAEPTQDPAASEIE